MLISANIAALAFLFALVSAGASTPSPSSDPSCPSAAPGFVKPCGDFIRYPTSFQWFDFRKPPNARRHLITGFIVNYGIVDRRYTSMPTTYVAVMAQNKGYTLITLAHPFSINGRAYTCNGIFNPIDKEFIKRFHICAWLPPQILGSHLVTLSTYSVVSPEGSVLATDAITNAVP